MPQKRERSLELEDLGPEPQHLEQIRGGRVVHATSAVCNQCNTTDTLIDCSALPVTKASR